MSCWSTEGSAPPAGTGRSRKPSYEPVIWATRIDERAAELVDDRLSTHPSSRIPELFRTFGYSHQALSDESNGRN